MSRRKTKAKEIRNPEHYFNKYIAMEIRKDREKEDEYYERFDSLEGLTGSTNEMKHDKLMLLAVNVDGSELEAALAESTLFGWIEMIENPDLYKVISGLSHQQKELLTWRYHFSLSQAETAQIMGMAQQTVSRHEERIFKKIKVFFKRGCGKS